MGRPVSCNGLAAAAIEEEAAARVRGEAQLVQERRALVAEVQCVREEGQAALRQLQRHLDTQRRQLEAEAQRSSKQAAELAAQQAAAHSEGVQQLQVGAQVTGEDAPWQSALAWREGGRLISAEYMQWPVPHMRAGRACRAPA